MTPTQTTPPTFEDIAAQLNYVSVKFQLSDEELALLFSTSRRSVENWKGRVTWPSAPVTVTIVEVLRIVDHVESLLGQDAVRNWLFSSNPDFGLKQPADLIASGELREVEAELDS